MNIGLARKSSTRTGPMGRVWLLLTVFTLVLLLGLTACGSSEQEPVSPGTSDAAVAGEPGTGTTAAGGYTTVDVETTYEQLSANQEAQLLDVREPSEWESTGIPRGAVLIPLGEIEQRAPAELAKDGPVYVICRSGNRSRTASETLVGLGYTEVYNVDGGIQDWIAAGLPVEPYEP